MKKIKNILIKASGDISENKIFNTFVENKARENFVVVVSGGGTEISQRLEEAGFSVSFDDVHGRITESWEERRMARGVLEEKAKKMQDDFVGKGVIVIPSVINVGGVICHINGDNYVKSAYLGFDEIYVFTLEERVNNKKKIFKNYEKIKVMGI